MKQDTHTKTSTIEAYQREQFDTLQSQYPDIIAKLDALIRKDPHEASEFFQQVEAYTLAAQQDLTKNSELSSIESETQIQDNDVSYFTQEVIDDSGMIDGEEREKLLWMADVILRYKKIKDFSWKLPRVAVLNYTFMSTEQTLQDMISWKDIVTHSQNSNEVDTKTMIIDRTDTGIESEYSHDIRQNIIYRIAKEFHSYGGANNMQELIMYFTPKHDGEENEKWLYYDPEKKQWMINDDYDIDIPLDFSNIENKSIDQIMADRFQKVPSWQKIAMAGTIPGIGWVASSLLSKQHIDAIDTKTETTDNQLNREFFAKVRKIIEEEKKAIDPQYKTTIDKKIHDYLDTNIVDGYIKLPWYLIQEAQRVGLGDLTYRFFTKKEGKIVGLTSNDYMSSPMTVSWITKTYINDIDGKEQWATIESITKESIKSVNKSQKEIIKKTNEIVKKIETAARSLVRANRWKVIYDPMTERLSSRWTGTKISEKNWNYILDDGKLSITYTSLDEAIAVAVVKNRFTGEYIKKNPNMNLKYQRYLGIWPKWLRDVNNGWSRRYANDTRLLTDDFIKKNLPISFIDWAHQKKIIEYFIS